MSGERDPSSVRRRPALIHRVALSCFQHPWRTLGAWVLVLAIAFGSALVAGGSFADGTRLRGTDSDAAYELLGRGFASQGNRGDEITIAYAATSGLDSPAVHSVVDRFLSQVRRLDLVASVSGPTRFARGTTVGTGTLTLTVREERAAATLATISQEADFARMQGVEIDFASWAFAPGGLNRTAEIVGILAAIAILFLSFGSLVVTGIPILTAFAGVAAGTALVWLWSAIVPTPDFTSEVAMMIGLGVGIDYAVFFVTRYLGFIGEGRSREEAIAAAAVTAGRAIVFAGSIVMVSLLGLLVIGMSYFRGLALGAASTVAVAVSSALTLVPALLSFVGSRHLVRAPRSGNRERGPLSRRWATFVQRNAAASAAVGVVVLALLVSPVFSMRLASADLGTTPKGTTSRTAYDRVAEAFGRGVNGPLVVAVPGHADLGAEGMAGLVRFLRSTPGVATAFDADLSADRSVARIVLIPDTGPQDSATTKLVHRLRSQLRGPGGQTIGYVGGSTASDVDFADLIGRRLPWFIGSVLIASLLLLLVVFRSVLVAIKAIVLNLMSIGSAYGLMVVVFQWGWLASLFGIHQRAPIEPWAPMMLFAIVFGLSMDYEVFLLSAVQERFRVTGNNSSAVADGLASTARVITAAAAIMVAVFGAFVANDLRAIKVVGFGLSAAVFIDATVVRMLLVPASMQLLGDLNWWLPGWLDRLLPRIVSDQSPPSSDGIGPAVVGSDCVRHYEAINASEPTANFGVGAS